ncbi:hypothetical protein WUBG_05084, partial [Wuchereria bancrofti]
MRGKEGVEREYLGRKNSWKWGKGERGEYHFKDEKTTENVSILEKEAEKLEKPEVKEPTLFFFSL